MLNQTEIPQSIQAYRRLIIAAGIYAVCLPALHLVLPNGPHPFWHIVGIFCIWAPYSWYFSRLYRAAMPCPTFRKVWFSSTMHFLPATLYIVGYFCSVFFFGADIQSFSPVMFFIPMMMSMPLAGAHAKTAERYDKSQWELAEERLPWYNKVW